jgi:putative ABC transport system permease protein
MIGNYIKLALKVLARRKFFTFISLFGISLTLVVLMVATAIFDNLFSPRAPESRLDRTLTMYTMGIYGHEGGMTTQPGYRFLDKYVRGLPGAEAISFFSTSSPAAMYHRGQKIDTHIRRTDGAYWRILDFKFLEGGPITQADDDKANFVAVITDDMRQKLFNGKPALGKFIEVEGRRFRVIGVVPAVPMTRMAAFSEIWAPNSTSKDPDYKRQETGGHAAMVLARDKSDFPKLRQALAERLDRYVFEDPKNYHKIVAGLDTPFEAVARMFLGAAEHSDNKRKIVFSSFLIGVVLLFITLPTMNLVSINLSRIMERASEIGVRKAFGASGRALVGQFVVENVVLTVIGGLAGFILSVGAVTLLNRANPIPYMTFDVNARIFVWGMLIAAAFGVISGVYPAWRMSRMHPVNALRGGAQ